MYYKICDKIYSQIDKLLVLNTKKIIIEKFLLWPLSSYSRAGPKPEEFLCIWILFGKNKTKLIYINNQK